MASLSPRFHSFLQARRSSVSCRAKRDALLPSRRTSCQNPFPSRHMILNFVIEPWCQYSILRRTASRSSVTGHKPKPVSPIEITVGRDLVGKITLSSRRFRELGIESDFVAHLWTEAGIARFRMIVASRVTSGIGPLNILMVRAGKGQYVMLRLCGGL